MADVTIQGIFRDAISAGLRKVASGFNTFVATVDNAAKGLDNIGDSILKVAGGLTEFSQKIVNVGKDIFNFTQGFDKSIARSTAIMGDLSDALREDLVNAALEASDKSAKSAEEIGESFFFLSSAGLDVQQSIAALPSVLQFSTAGAFKLSDAIDLLTGAQGALGLASKDPLENLDALNRVSDVLVKGNTLASSTTRQLAEAMTIVGGSLRLFNKDIEEGAAALLAFADRGSAGFKAGQSLLQVLRDLTNQAVKNKDEFKKFGIEIFDASENVRNIADIIEDFEEKLGNASDEQKKFILLQLGIPKRSQEALLTLLGLSDAIRGYEVALRDAGGTTQEVAEKQLLNLGDQFKILQGQFRNIVIRIGLGLKPAFEILFSTLSLVARALNSLAQAFKTLPKEFRVTIAVVGLLLAGLAPLTLALGLLAKGVAAVLGVLGGMAFVIGNLLPLFAGLGIAITGIVLLFRRYGSQVDESTQSTEEYVEELKKLEKASGQSGLALRRATSDLSEQVQKLDDAREALKKFREERSVLTFGEFNRAVSATAGRAIEELGLETTINEVTEQVEKLAEAQEELRKTDPIAVAYRRFRAELNRTNIEFTVNIKRFGETEAAIIRTRAELQAYTNAAIAVKEALGENTDQAERYESQIIRLSIRLRQLLEVQALENIELDEQSKALLELEKALALADIKGIAFASEQEVLQAKITATKAAIVELSKEIDPSLNSALISVDPRFKALVRSLKLFEDRLKELKTKTIEQSDSLRSLRDALRLIELSPVVSRQQELQKSIAATSLEIGELTRELMKQGVENIEQDVEYRILIDTLSKYRRELDDVTIAQQILKAVDLPSDLEQLTDFAASTGNELANLESTLRSLGSVSASTLRVEDIDFAEAALLAYAASLDEAIIKLRALQATTEGEISLAIERLIAIIEAAKRRTQELGSELDGTKDKTRDFGQGVKDSLGGFAEAFSTASSAGALFGNLLASELSRAIDLFVDGKLSFEEFAASFLKNLAKMILQTIIFNAIAGAFGGASIFTPSAAAGKRGGEMTHQGIRRDIGGPVPGPSGIDADIIPALLSPHEWVIRQRAARYYGNAVMRALNDMRIPRDVLRGYGTAVGVPIDGRKFQAGGEADSFSGRSGVIPATIIANEEMAERLFSAGTNSLLRIIEENSGTIQGFFSSSRSGTV
jgi:TP901 family phage tail tape measure protein